MRYHHAFITSWGGGMLYPPPHPLTPGSSQELRLGEKAEMG